LAGCIGKQDSAISGINLEYLRQFRMMLEGEIMYTYVALEGALMKDVIFSYSWMIYIDRFEKDVQKAFRVGELMHMNPDSYETIKELTNVQAKIKTWSLEFFGLRADQQEILLKVGAFSYFPCFRGT
jgi:hypothetical protein